MTSTTTKLNVKPPNGQVILALEERGFCVGLSSDGKTVKKESRVISELQDIINSSTVTWIDYVVEDFKKDTLKVATELGFSESLINSLLKADRGAYEDLDSEMGMIIPAIIVEGFDVKVDPLMVLIGKNLVITLHTTEVKRFFRLRRYAETFMRKIKITIPLRDKITSVLIRIIGENNSRNFDHLREIEENSDRLSKKLSDPKTPREVIGKEIHEMKHALITYLTGLWETVDVLNTLRYGDPELLSDDPKIIGRLGALVTEVNNHIGLAEHLSEVLASGLEVVQSIYNNQLQILNNKMALLVAYLTILGTAVLVPNTLATVLSNPVYGLTIADEGWFTALIVISTIISIIGSYWWVKNKGLLPERTD
ncbi:MAG: CorA family divalent cation transporter [Candidatus Micrarchaeota archaeon]|nr:CorA family divalent cation transporter [Candidatus Micrarchaeota archaeon]